MKTIEEKAKAYDEIIERAKTMLASSEVMYGKENNASQLITDIIPELKESEDERIRKGLIDYLKADMEHNPSQYPQFYDRAIAYLERQKEPEKIHKPIEFKNDELVEIIKGEFEGFRRLLKKKGIDYEPQRGYWEGFARLFDSSAREYVKEQKEQNPTNIELIPRSWYMEGYHDREFGKEPKWIIKTGEGGPKYELNPKYGQPLAGEQKPSEKQDYSGLTDFERAIHRGFLCAGVENVPVTIIKETAQDCLAHLPAEWSEEDEKMLSSAIHLVELDARAASYVKNVPIKDVLVWLENIRNRFCPQPHWKPSQEQMEALQDAKDDYKDDGKKYGNPLYKQIGVTLESLYTDLQKLK